MGGKGKGGAPPGGSAITWGPAARSAGWGWDPPSGLIDEHQAPFEAGVPQSIPEPAAAAGPAASAAPDAQATGGDSGSITTTQDTGEKLAQTVTAPSMWTDRLKAQSLNGSGSMHTTGQV